MEQELAKENAEVLELVVEDLGMLELVRANVEVPDLVKEGLGMQELVKENVSVVKLGITVKTL